MTTKTNQQIEQKKSFLQRIRAAYQKRCQERKEDREFHHILREYIPCNIPRSFRRYTPSDKRFTEKPQLALALFQKMIQSIRDPEVRLSIINNLCLLTTSPGADIEYEREKLNFQIFYGVTRTHFAYPLRASSVTYQDIQNRDFFHLIGMGVCAYEKATSQKRDRFNKAVMPNVKKTNIVVPSRLHQYVR